MKTWDQGTAAPPTAPPLTHSVARLLIFAVLASVLLLADGASAALVVFPALLPLGRLPLSAVRGGAGPARTAATKDDFSAVPLSVSISASANPGVISTRRDVLASSIVGGVGLAMSSASPSGAAAPASRDGDKSVGWGIVGLGDVTAVKSGPAFLKCAGSNLVAVMRRTPGKAAEWVRSQDGPDSSIRAYDDLDKFLADPDLEAVYVSTPPGSHLEICRSVAEAGKHCYVEKPVGRSGAETRAIAAVFEERGLNLFTAYVSRAYKRTEVVRRLLEEEAVGDRVVSVRYRLRGTGGARGMDIERTELPWRLRASMSGGGLIMDVGCHVIDRIDYLCGPIVDVEGKAENRGSQWQDVEDFVSIQGKIVRPSPGSTAVAFLSEGATVDLEWDFSPPKKGGISVDELIIEGSRGSLRMAAMSPSLPVEVLDAKGGVLRTLTFEPPQHAAQALIQLVTDELRGKPPKRRSPSRADNAIRTSEVLDTAMREYYGGRDDAFWDRPESWPGRPKTRES